MSSKSPSWLFLLPIKGASREAALSLYGEMEKLISPGKITIFDTENYLKAYRSMLKNDDGEISVDIMNQSIVVSALQHDITHLFVPALAPVTLFTLQLLKKNNIHTIHWFIEDFRRAEYWRSVLPGYSTFIAVQKGPVKDACKELNIQYEFIPTAVSVLPLKDSYPLNHKTKNADCAFIGIPSEYRIHFLEELYQKGVSLNIAGEGWNRYNGILKTSIVKGDWVNLEESTTIMQQCSTAINLSFASPHLDASSNQISPRVFDVLGAGVPLITEDIPLLYESVKGYTYKTFKNIDEAIKVIKEILNTDIESLKPDLDKNRERVQKHDSWAARAKQIINLV